MSMSQTDERLEKMETIRIPFEAYRKALKRNYLDEPDRWGRNYVVRLYPPFEATMEAHYYESERGVHYDNNWDLKPIHIQPEWILHDADIYIGRTMVEWPTEVNTREELTEEEIAECGGIDEAVAEGRGLFWDELKHALPETINTRVLPGVDPMHRGTLRIEWEFDD